MKPPGTIAAALCLIAVTAGSVRAGYDEAAEYSARHTRTCPPERP